MITPFVTTAVAVPFLPDNTSTVGIEVYAPALVIVIDCITWPDSDDVALPDTPSTNTYGALRYPLPRRLTAMVWRAPLNTTSESL